MLYTIVLSLFVACGSKDGDTSSNDSSTADLANGESIFNTTCGACHPASGSIPDLASSLSDEEFTAVITNGSGGMPAQSSLSAQDVTDVVAYVRSIE